MQKTIYTLAVDGYSEAITSRTFPLMRNYARKIGAEFVVITEREYAAWPPACEKFQVGELAEERGDDWSLFFDADALIHPETPDVTAHLTRDTVMHHGVDRSTVRFRPDRFYLRDGRFQAPGNWFCVFSDLTREIYEFPRDITLAQAIDHITPTINEINHGITRAHLVDDFLVGRNAAKYGIKVVSFIDVCQQTLGLTPIYFWHVYTMTTAEKVHGLQKTLVQWGCAPESSLREFGGTPKVIHGQTGKIVITPPPQAPAPALVVATTDGAPVADAIR